MTSIEDLGLPTDVIAAATVEANGEVTWPLDDAAAAINALAAAAQVVLGVDVRDYDQTGRFVEVAWSSYEPDGDDDVERGRHQALAALQRPGLPGSSILITWRPER
jgi:VCBS repeat-containing protein